MDPQIRIRLNSRLLPALIVILLIVQLLDPFDGWIVLLVALGAAWLLGYAWVRSLAKHLRLRREIRFGWAQVGDRLEERFTLRNDGFLPGLWVEIQDQSNMPGYQVSRATGVGGFSQMRWTTHGVCSRRGLYTLGPASLRSGDPLGIYSIEIHDPRTASLMVTPPVVPLPTIEVSPGGRTGEGRPRPDAPERTVSVSGVREYTPGDSLRWVHWPTSARRDDFYVRLFEGTPSGDWWVLLDLDHQVQVGKGADSTVEHAVILAASLADRGLRLRRAVGLAVNSENLVWQAPKQGEHQRWEILRALALVTPAERSIAHLLKRVRPNFGKHSSLVIITTNTNPSWIESLLPLVWNGAVPTVLLLDPQTFGGSQQTTALQSALVDLHLAHYIIDRQLLDRPEARPGRRGRWDWRVSPTGRAIAVSEPRNPNWKELV